MKATGIVRRIDDLGRVVVPKEIRRTLRIREGDPMEIFTNHEGEVILKKYSPIGEMDNFAKQYAEVLSKVSDCKVIISDRDQVIAAAGGVKKSNIGKNISTQLEELMEERITHNSMQSKKYIPIIQGEEAEKREQIACPIISEGDVIGSVVIEGKEENSVLNQGELKLATVAAGFLGSQMEN